jgi:16S rRNA processing protein RimM
LIRPRGKRGELIAEIYSSQAGRAEKLGEVMLERDGRRVAARVENVWHHDGRPVLKFSGIDSIGDAEPWAGADVLVPEAERAQPGDDEFSHADLIGCRVVAGQEIGMVAGVEDYGGAPLLRVERSDGRELLIPFARSICREIDVAAKTIRVELPEGLLDL